MLKLITTPLYGKDGYQYISMSDLTKCAMRGGGKTGGSKIRGGAAWASERMIQKCFMAQRVIWREAAILKPEAIVIFAYDLFKELGFPSIPVSKSTTTIQPATHYQKVASKSLPWYELSIETAWSKNVRVLITADPDGYNPIEFAKLISAWLTTFQKQPASETLVGRVLREIRCGQNG
ncbi:MAG: hypothetical protein H7834_05550 [Magnetococcus sp. YQC-9]